ncbi:MAG: GTP-binding protein [Chloroflexi bacterium]|nr:GTP-binding protein [Chloroflexota bacterium]
MVNEKKIPVIVVTGFLGSGKTTLIKNLLLHPQTGETAVIVNEFGEIGLDHFLVRKTDERTVLLNSGCVCCSMRGDLNEAIRDLFSKREKGEIPRFQRVVVETTGLADPVPIMQTVLSEPVLRYHFQLERVITTVDAPNGKENLATYVESVRQIAASDFILVTKEDLTSEEATQELKAELQNANPMASIVDSPFGIVDFDPLLRSDIQRGDLDEIGRLREIESKVGRMTGQMGSHTEGIRVSSHCIIAEKPLNWQMFGIWLTFLLHRHGQRILRVKGLLNLGDGRGPLLVQGVQHVIHAPRHLKAWPDNDQRSRIVFVVRDLDPQNLEESLHVFQTLATAT